MLKKIFHSNYFFLVIVGLATISFIFEGLFSFIHNLVVLYFLHIVFNSLFLILLFKFKRTETFKKSEMRPQIGLYIAIGWLVLTIFFSLINIFGEISI